MDAETAALRALTERVRALEATVARMPQYCAAHGLAMYRREDGAQFCTECEPDRWWRVLARQGYLAGIPEPE